MHGSVVQGWKGPTGIAGIPSGWPPACGALQAYYSRYERGTQWCGIDSLILDPRMGMKHVRRIVGDIDEPVSLELRISSPAYVDL